MLLPDRKETTHNLKRLDDKGARSRGSVEFFIFSAILLGLTGGDWLFDIEMNRARSARSLVARFFVCSKSAVREKRFLLETSRFTVEVLFSFRTCRSSRRARIP